jgi:glycopeptide antibiotics resistance protein
MALNSSMHLSNKRTETAVETYVLSLIFEVNQLLPMLQSRIISDVESKESALLDT